MLSIVALIIASLLDTLTTRMVINAGGYEMNPVYGKNPSTLKLLIIHAVMVLAVAALIYFEPAAVIGGWIAAGLFFVVAANNYRVWRGIKKQ